MFALTYKWTAAERLITIFALSQQINRWAELTPTREKRLSLKELSVLIGHCLSSDKETLNHLRSEIFKAIGGREELAAAFDKFHVHIEANWPFAEPAKD